MKRTITVTVQMAGRPAGRPDVIEAKSVRVEPMPCRGYWVVADGRELVCSEVLIDLGPEKGGAKG